MTRCDEVAVGSNPRIPRVELHMKPGMLVFTPQRAYELGWMLIEAAKRCGYPTEAVRQFEEVYRGGE
jgi:hypothetical protein